MKVECPNCGYAGNIVDTLIPKEGQTIKCPKCGEKFHIEKDYVELDNSKKKQKEKAVVDGFIKNKRAKMEFRPYKYKSEGEKESEAFLHACLYVGVSLVLLILIPLAFFVAPVFFIILAILIITIIVLGIVNKGISKQ